MSDKHLTYRILGTARPERRSWWFDPIFISLRHGIKFSAEMQGSRFVAELDLVDGQDVDLLTARNVAANYLRALVDALGFLCGTAIDCEVSEIIAPDGRLYALDPVIHELSVEYSSYDLQSLVTASISDHAVRLGLADIRMAIRNPEDTTFLCYRAIEGVKQQLGSWDALHTKLGTDRDEIMKLKNLADHRRHGNHTYATHGERIEALILANRVLTRYATYVFDSLPAPVQASPDT